ncbi:hypothetical protein DACRYDRAFT_110935 [Dacryopinax primogenitus]|uniref:DUF202 domain-containing protein n=1 Tax=Dacryopinax primogenitus (strain DJM 731) TaxID=1858805 RepID=M5FY56_DACPD|nr:uncharacterized protein DACRYDRAFT_110935 [Dacryopinax primogenitus]EJT98491.1 hypothetical protein DACRYDRAFT_110935 [Dacryopinax primogenitus]
MSAMSALHPQPSEDKTLIPSSPSFLLRFWQSVNPFSLPPSIPARGNLARDHLANERTFLAWTRTCLALATTGVALVQLFAISALGTTEGRQRTMTMARPVGGTMVAVGGVVLVVGVHRYFRTQIALMSNSFPPSRIAPLLLSIMTAVLLAVVFVIVVTMGVP